MLSIVRAGLHRLLRVLLPCLLAVPALAADFTFAVSRSPLSLPVYVAQAQGYFKEERVSVDLRECTSGKGCLADLLAHRAQLATVAELPCVFSSFERDDYAIIATIAASLDSSHVVSRKSSGIDTVADLRGKRVGVYLGTSPHYYLDALLLYSDIDPKSLQIVSLTPETLIDALLNRKVDAVSAFTPQALAAMKALGAEGSMLKGPRLYNQTFNVVSDRHSLQKRREHLVRLLRALHRAERWIADQPDAARLMMQSRLNLDAPTVQTLFAGISYRVGLDQSLVSTMEGQARWALREGHVPATKKVPNYLHYLDSGPLKAAIPTAVTP